MNFTTRTQPCAAGVHGTYRVQWTAQGTWQPFGPRTGPTLCSNELVGGPHGFGRLTGGPTTLTSGVASSASSGLAAAWRGGSAGPAACEAIDAGITATPCLAAAGPGCFAGIPRPTGSTAVGVAAPAAGCGVVWWACPIDGMDPDGTNGACNVKLSNRWARTLYSDPNVLCAVTVGNREIAQTKIQIRIVSEVVLSDTNPHYKIYHYVIIMLMSL